MARCNTSVPRTTLPLVLHRVTGKHVYPRRRESACECWMECCVVIGSEDGRAMEERGKEKMGARYQCGISAHPIAKCRSKLKAPPIDARDVRPLVTQSITNTADAANSTDQSRTLVRSTCHPHPQGRSTVLAAPRSAPVLQYQRQAGS